MVPVKNRRGSRVRVHTRVRLNKGGTASSFALCICRCARGFFSLRAGTPRVEKGQTPGPIPGGGEKAEARSESPGRAVPGQEAENHGEKGQNYKLRQLRKLRL